MTRTDLANLVNARRVMHGAEKIPESRLMRIIRCCFGDEPARSELFGEKGQMRRSKAYPMCAGFDVFVGALVEHTDCEYFCKSFHAKRCHRCGPKQVKFEKLKRKRESRAQPMETKSNEKNCIGYHPFEGGHIPCGRAIPSTWARCQRCGKAQIRESKKIYRKANAPALPGADQVRSGRDPSPVPHRITHWCGECCGLSERRPLQGLCKCGQPWRPERLQKTEPLRSNAGSMCTRHHFR